MISSGASGREVGTEVAARPLSGGKGSTGDLGQLRGSVRVLPFVEGSQLLSETYRRLTEQHGSFWVGSCCRESLDAIDRAYDSCDTVSLESALETFEAHVTRHDN